MSELSEAELDGGRTDDSAAQSTRLTRLYLGIPSCKYRFDGFIVRACVENVVTGTY